MKYGSIDGVTRPLSRVIQGTLGLGRLTEVQAFALLDSVYGEGARAFDTAPVYGQGRAEALLGQWLSRQGTRGSVVIIDKGAHPNAAGARVNPRDISADVARSLTALDVGSIDLYLLHRDDPKVPVGEIIDCLNEARGAGRIDAFGASNWTHARIAEANDYARSSGQSGFVASSPELSLLEPVSTWPGCLSIGGPSGAAARAWYRTAQFPLLSWSPLAGGFLGGKLTRELCRNPGTPEERRVVGFYATDENLARRERLSELARQRRMGLGQAAIGYVASQGLNVFATVGCDNADEFRECVLGFAVSFSAEELCWLEAGGAKPA